MSSTKGYTIIELLAVIFVFVIIGGIIAGILSSTLRGTNKSKILSSTGQNGSYALSAITATLNSAQKVTALGGQTIPSASLPDCSGLPSPSGSSIQFQMSDGSTTTLACQNYSGVSSITQTNGSGTISLIDTSQVQVQSGACSFTCSQKNGPYDPPLIQVQFTLTDKNAAVVENQSTQSFKTSVVVAGQF